MLITVSVFRQGRSTNGIRGINPFAERSLVENQEEKWTELVFLSFWRARSCRFNNPPLRRWKNATPAEKSTSSIHHHHCRRHFCPVECVNFKRRNKKKRRLPSSSSFLSLSLSAASPPPLLCLKKTHHQQHCYTIRWSAVCLLAYIHTYNPRIVISLLQLIYLWHS